MTRQDFILSILASIIAAIGYDYARKGAVYVRSKKFRKARRRVMRNAPAQISAVLAPAYPVIPFVVRGVLNPYTVGLLFVIGLPILLSQVAGPPDSFVAFDPMSGIPGLDMLGLGF